MTVNFYTNWGKSVSDSHLAVNYDEKSFMEQVRDIPACAHDGSFFSPASGAAAVHVLTQIIGIGV